MSHVFHGVDRRGAIDPEPTEEAWLASIDRYETYLRFFADRYLGGGALYNAAKHGLALSPSEMIGAELKGLAKRQGPGIRYLAVRRSEHDPRLKWHDVTHWVDADRLLAVTANGIGMIRNLWRVARFRYARAKDERLPVVMMTGPGPFDIMIDGLADNSNPMAITEMSMALSYWVADETDG